MVQNSSLRCSAYVDQTRQDRRAGQTLDPEPVPVSEVETDAAVALIGEAADHFLGLQIAPPQVPIEKQPVALRGAEIVDPVATAIEDEDIRARSAMQPVVMCPTIQPVTPIASIQSVTTIAAEKLVIACSAEQPVIVRPP